MKISLQTPDFRASGKLNDYVMTSVDRISTWSDRILEAQVCLKTEKSGTQKDKICELKLVIPGNDIFSSRQSETFEGAITEAIDAAQHQMRRWKETKSASSLRGTTVPPPEEEPEETED